MKKLLFIAFMAWTFSACIGNDNPLPPTMLPVFPESPGTPNSEQQGKSFTISTEAFYQASLTSSSSPGRVISLSLSPKRKAEMTTNYLDKSQILVDTGAWTTLESGNLQLNLKRQGTVDSFLLEFKTDGDKLVYTGSTYGLEGLVLWVKAVPQ